MSTPTALQQLRSRLRVHAHVTVIHHGRRPETQGRRYEVVAVQIKTVDLIARNTDVGTVEQRMTIPKATQDVEWISADVVRWTLPADSRHREATVTYRIEEPSARTRPTTPVSGVDNK